MAGHGYKRLELLEITGNGWTVLEMAGMSETAGNVLNWREKDGNDERDVVGLGAAAITLGDRSCSDSIAIDKSCSE